MGSQFLRVSLLILYPLFGAGSKHILLFDIWRCGWFGEHGWYVAKVRYWGPNCKFWTDTNSNFSEKTPKKRSSYTNCTSTIFCATIDNSDFCCPYHNHPFIGVIHWLVGLKYCLVERGAHTLCKALANNTVAVWWKLHIFWITGIFLVANISGRDCLFHLLTFTFCVLFLVGTFLWNWFWCYFSKENWYFLSWKCWVWKTMLSSCSNSWRQLLNSVW